MNKFKSRMAWGLMGCVVAFSCGPLSAQSDAQAKIIGNWRVDVALTEQYLQDNSTYDEQTAEFLKFVREMKVRFQNDGVITVLPDGSTEKQGMWKFVREERGLAQIQLIRGEEITDTTVRFLGDDSIVLAPANEIPLVLARVSAKPIEGAALQLIGTWECDSAETAKLEMNASFTQQQVDAMMDQALNMVIELRKDATFSATTEAGGEQKRIEGNWSAESPNPSTTDLRIQLNAARGPHAINVKLREDGKVVFWPDDEPGAVFAPRTESPEESR